LNGLLTSQVKKVPQTEREPRLFTKDSPMIGTK
jgi:hypothetical protein